MDKQKRATSPAESSGLQSRRLLSVESKLASSRWWPAASSCSDDDGVDEAGATGVELALSFLAAAAALSVAGVRCSGVCWYFDLRRQQSNTPHLRHFSFVGKYKEARRMMFFFSCNLITFFFQHGDQRTRFGTKSWMCFGATGRKRSAKWFFFKQNCAETPISG